MSPRVQGSEKKLNFRSLLINGLIQNCHLWTFNQIFGALVSFVSTSVFRFISDPTCISNLENALGSVTTAKPNQTAAK